MTPEQKKENQKRILDNLNEYVVDSRGNFIHIDSVISLDPKMIIGKESVIDHGKISDAIVSMILQNKEDWEVVLDEGYYIKNKRDGRIISGRGLGVKLNKRGYPIERDYIIIGELGYRKSIWENYEEEKKEEEEREKEWEKWWQEHLNNNSNDNQSVPSQNQPNQNQTPSTNNSPIPNQEPENQNNPSSNQNKQNQPTDNKPTNSLPTDIQKHYNSDPVKSELITNSNLTNKQDQQQAQELLKLIITAELLTKKGQFNQEILTKLLAIKKENITVYNELNKANRMDKVINALERIQKRISNNNNSATNNKKKNSLPTGIIIGEGMLLLIAGLGIMILMKKKMLKKKTKQKK